jgi:carbon monoxide dehydrogenase subunit G
VIIPISQRLASSRERVYAALTDPVLLQRCIDGCEKMVLTGEDAYDVDLKVGVAGMKGAYKGKVRLSAKQPPESLTLAVEGKGLPGFVRGTASLRFSDRDNGVLTFTVDGINGSKNITRELF